MSKLSEIFLNHLRRKGVLVGNKTTGEFYNDEVPFHICHLVDAFCVALNSIEERIEECDSRLQSLSINKPKND